MFAPWTRLQSGETGNTPDQEYENACAGCGAGVFYAENLTFSAKYGKIKPESQHTERMVNCTKDSIMKDLGNVLESVNTNG